MSGSIARKAGAAAALSMLIATSAAAAEAPLFVSIGDYARAPIGWTEFCTEHPEDCRTTPLMARDIVLTDKVWQDLVRVNDWVNRTVKPLTDIEHWGVVERWDYPDDGYGDCEDYVLLKRKLLLRAGWPRQALLISVVRDRQGDGHAVLTVKTDRGEFILDNQNEEILPWSQTGYRFVKRQSQTDPNLWVALGSPRPSAPATATLMQR
jgi:predicted transglutaminase-like cysteine proteinase